MRLALLLSALAKQSVNSSANLKRKKKALGNGELVVFGVKEMPGLLEDLKASFFRLSLDSKKFPRLKNQIQVHQSTMFLGVNGMM